MRSPSHFVNPSRAVELPAEESSVHEATTNKKTEAEESPKEELLDASTLEKAAGCGAELKRCDACKKPMARSSVFTRNGIIAYLQCAYCGETYNHREYRELRGVDLENADVLQDERFYYIKIKKLDAPIIDEY